MAINAGLSPDLIVNQVINSNKGEGYDFMTNEVKELTNSGIIDPAKVTRCALENAVSVASTLLTTGHAIVSQ
jgi:chaperonin GroEL